MKVHVINSMSGEIRIHRAGCKDIDRDKRRANSHWTQDVAPHAVAEAVAADMSEGFGWTPEDDEPAPWREEHMTVLPCCKVRS